MNPFQNKRIAKKKVIRCKYCNIDIANKNFCRHLKRHHITENEVENIFQHPKNSKSRKQALSLFRNGTNFDMFIQGEVRRNRKPRQNLGIEDITYPCAYCKGLFAKRYLKRHVKICTTAQQVLHRKSGKPDHASDSQTLVACAMDPSHTIAKLNVKTQVSFNLPNN